MVLPVQGVAYHDLREEGSAPLADVVLAGSVQEDATVPDVPYGPLPGDGWEE